MDWWNGNLETWSRNLECETGDSLTDRTPHPEPIFRWHKSFRSTIPKHFEKLIIATGPPSSLFLTSQFQQKTHIASIIFPHVSLAGCTLVPSVNNSLTTIFTVEQFPNTCYVACQVTVENGDAYAWTKSVFTNIVAKSVFVLDVIDELKIQDVLEESEIEFPALRMLKTNSANPVPLPKNISCPFLESPQIICGLPASILTHCQIHRIAATLYLSAESQTQLGPETLIGFESVFPSVNGGPIHKIDYLPLIQTLKARRTSPLFT